MTTAARILVVDDERGMREGCKRILVSEGYEVETAEDGVAGLDLFLRRGPFDAALVDLKMPRMSGIELVEQIRRKDPDVVLLVITAYATIETAVEATKRGAYGYIPKPFTPEELLLPVRNGLEHRALALEARRLRAEAERRLTEVAFERSKSNTILTCMTDGVLVVNRDRQLVLCNPAAARILLLPPDARIPAPLSELSEHAPLRDLLLQALDVTTGTAILSRELALDGCHYMVNATPLRDEAGEVLGAIAVLRDVTELMKLETAKSTFISMVAHEVKNPLAAVEGYLDAALQELPADQRVAAMLQRALARTRRLDALIGDLLSLTAIETGNFNLRRAPLDLRPILQEVIQSQSENARKAKIALEHHPAEAPAVVMADRDALFCVFNNLVDNAIKYTPEGGCVRLSDRREGLFHVVEVADNGMGIAPEDRERIFDEFFRARNELTSKVPGTGLGLTLVKRLVDMHQGRIRLFSEPGKGSRFLVSLPAANG